MTDAAIHENDPGFDAFVEDVMRYLAESAAEREICLECFSDRMVVELVAGMARSGVAVSAILAMVGEGIDAAEADAVPDGSGRSRRVHGRRAQARLARRLAPLLQSTVRRSERLFFVRPCSGRVRPRPRS